MIIENAVRQYREAANESGASLARAVGVSQSLISRIERGERTCPDWLKVRIAERYGVSITDLFFRPADDFKSSVAVASA